MSKQELPASIPEGPLGEISQEPPAFEAFLDRHQFSLIILAALLAIAAAVYVVYSGIKKGGEESAGKILAHAESSDDYQEIIDNHSDTAAAFSAKVLLAEEQWEKGEKEAAFTTLKEFVETEQDHPARPSAEASLAVKLWSEGKEDEALAYLQELAEEPESRFVAPYAFISMGDIYSQKGELEKAEAAYEEVEKGFPGSPFVAEARSRRLLVKSAPPVEIAAPITVPEVKFSEDGEKPTDSEVSNFNFDLNDQTQPRNPLSEDPEAQEPDAVTSGENSAESD